MKIARALCYIFTGMLLCAITTAIPVFTAPPAFLSLNIAGIALVSYGLGPLPGGLFGAFTHVALNSIGMGSGVIAFILLTRLFEGFLPGAMDKAFSAKSVTFRRHMAWFSPFAAALALTVLVKPLSLILAWLFSPYSGGEALLPLFRDEMLLFFRSGFGVALAAYTFSCTVGWVTSHIFELFFAKFQAARHKRPIRQVI